MVLSFDFWEFLFYVLAHWIDGNKDFFYEVIWRVFFNDFQNLS